jgi:excinuclease ABC subunit C
MARENARLLLKASKENKESNKKLLTSLKECLNLASLPVAMEGVDISTTGGGEAVGAVVHFKDGLPLRSRYRRYKIKTVAGMDDYAMLREVLYRRLKRGLKEDSLPDLILVDGGKGQLNCALEVAGILGTESVAFLGIRKGETRARAVSVPEDRDDKIVTPSGGNKATLTPGSPGFSLLQRLRDEAHRFAITYHRKRRQRAGMASLLDRVEGLGAFRKQNLLSHFGGQQGLKRASKEEIMKVPGIGPVLAERIYHTFHSS